MTTIIFLLKVIIMGSCLWSPLSASREDIAQEFIEHVLNIPNPDRVLNTVLGRLERNRQALLERIRPRFSDDANCEEPEFQNLPEYTQPLGEGAERGLRHVGPKKHRPICAYHKEKRLLNTEEYEYRPAYYVEVRCNKTTEDDVTIDGDTIEIAKMCTNLGFACVQWNKTIHLTKRRYTSDCWETETMVIPAGCECMWPEHRLGGILNY